MAVNQDQPSIRTRRKAEGASRWHPIRMVPDHERPVVDVFEAQRVQPAEAVGGVCNRPWAVSGGPPLRSPATPVSEIRAAKANVPAGRAGSRQSGSFGKRFGQPGGQKVASRSESGSVWAWQTERIGR